MADFERAFLVLFDLEGGDSDDPDDRGGRTRYGITAETLAAWNKEQGTDWTIDSLTIPQAKTIYRTWYWAWVRGNDIPDQAIATALFCQCVNGGQGPAIIQLQAVVGVPQDGAMGPKTLEALEHAITNLSARSVLKRYLNGWALRYKQIIARRPSQAKFADGWENRLEKLRTAA